MPKNAKLPRFSGRPTVHIRFGEPMDLAHFAGKEKDRLALRSATDEIMYEIMQLSGQDYMDEYAARTATVPLPESARPTGEDIDLSEETIAG
jgi:1-acyl-sn-glycerol-3-phosphate acyltransferase